MSTPGDGPVYDENPPAMPEPPAEAAAVPVEEEPAAATDEPVVEGPMVDEPVDGPVVAEEPRVEVVGPGRLRLLLEGIGVFVLGLVVAGIAIPALRDRHQAIYQELMTQAFGPDRHGLGRLVKNGTLPLWTRYSFGGEPYAANSQHETFYPLSLPFVFLKTSTAMDLVIALHIALAFLGMWAFLRIALRSSMWGAVFAGLSFGISSQILDHVALGDQLHVLVWMPWLFLAIHLALERGKVRHVVFAGVIIGLQFLAGHPEEWLYSLGASVLYGVIYAFGAGPWRQLPKRVLLSGVRIAGSVVAFVLLFGWQLFPTLQLKGQGFRNADFTEQHPLPYLGGVNALLPDYGKVLFGENVAFASVVALGLFGLFFAGGRRRWLKVYLAVSAALGFVMALGNQSRYPQFYNAVYDHVSLIHQFRVPSRWLLLTCFALCVGAGLGLDVLLERTTVRVRLTRGLLALIALAVFFGVAFAFARTNNDGQSYTKWALAAVAAVAVWAVAQVPWVPRFALAIALLAVAGAESVKARPHAEYRQKVLNVVYDDYGQLGPAIAAGGGRSLTIAQAPLDTEQAGEFVYPSGVSGQIANYYRVAETPKLDVRPNNNLAVGAESIIGRDNGLLPLQRYRDFFDAATGIGGNLGSGIETTLPSAYNWSALDLLGVNWLVTNQLAGPVEVAEIKAANGPNAYTGPTQADAAVLAAHGFVPAQKQDYVQLWKRSTPAPVVRIMHDVTAPVPSRQDRIAMLSDRSFPLLTRAIVERPVSVQPSGLGTESVGRTSVGAEKVTTTVTLASSGLVVLADPYYPGWEVSVDGHAATSVAVDSAFRGVVVPAGTHTVTWHYVDRPFDYGLLLAGITIVGLVGSGIVGGRRRRRRSTVLVPAEADGGETQAGVPVSEKGPDPAAPAGGRHAAGGRRGIARLRGAPVAADPSTAEGHPDVPGLPDSWSPPPAS